MTVFEYESLASKDVSKLCDLVDQMDIPSRYALRLQLEAAGCTNILRSMYFDYKTQSWI